MQSIFRGFKSPYKTLQLLEKMYLYGAFSKQDVMALFSESFSASEKRLYSIIKTFGEDHIKALNLNQKSGYYADYNYLTDIYNYMMKIYRLKITTPSRLKGYFLVLSVLAEHHELSVFDMLNRISEKGHVFNDTFLRNLLEDMTEHGLIVTQFKGRTQFFSVAKDTLDGMDVQSITELHRALKYFSNTLYPFAIGDLTLKSTEEYALYSRDVSFPKADWLRVTNRSFHLTLYEEYIWQVLQMMENDELLNVKMSNFEMGSGLFKPLAFELPVDDGELYLKGQLTNHAIAYIPMYKIMAGEDLQCTLPENDFHINDPEHRFELTLDVSFQNEEHLIHRLIAVYPKADITINRNSVEMDLKRYEPEKQIEITLEQITLFKSLRCSAIQRQKIQSILTEGVLAHETDQ